MIDIDQKDFTKYLNTRALLVNMTTKEYIKLCHEWMDEKVDDSTLEQNILNSNIYIKCGNLGRNPISQMTHERALEETKSLRKELAESVLEYRKNKRIEKGTQEILETTTEIERILDGIFEYNEQPKYIEDKFKKLYDKVKGLTDDIQYTLGLKYNIIKDKNINRDTRFTIHHRPNNNIIYFIYTDRGEFKGILPLYKTWY